MPRRRASWVLGTLGLAALGLVFPNTASAQWSIFSELELGVLAHDVPVLGSRKESGADLNGELRFVSPVPESLVSGIAPPFRWMLTPRPNIGGSVNTSGYTSQFYFGLTWTAELFKDVFRPEDGVFFGIGFGPAFNNGHISTISPSHKSLGSNVLFHPSLELGYRFDRPYSIEMYWDHSSNAGLATKNEGLNNLGIRFGIRF
ncbi:MAG: acyloxyacyl hydrolase [Acetobacteraceae bacterium]|nr:acyloxyacyl hydrolase [Acetobacteraceae bacterium]MBV8523779.1 acyloxyacyl hydrolase [Acetobacteraceae bacterium]